MIKNLPYKQKCYLLFAAFVFYLFAAYNFSIKDTIALVGDVSEKEVRLNWLREKEKELPSLKLKMAEFQRSYSSADSASVRDKLTAYISDFADHNRCLVTEIPVNLKFKNENLKVQTNTFTIEGSFINLLSLLNRLETDCKYVARIMSARFFSQRDQQTKRKRLYMTIITQSFQQNSK